MSNRLAVWLVFGLAGSVFAGTLTLPSSRGGQTPEEAARQFARNFAKLTAGERQASRAQGRHAVTTPPMTVRVGAGVRAAPGTSLSLSFSPGEFSPAYQQLLQDVFAQSASARDLIFGLPGSGGTVAVRNFDANLGDREVVAGGVYVEAGGQREIRFPVYQVAEVAAVNFLHCLLLATLGSDPFPGDGWHEGIVRAAVMRIVRTPGAMPAGLDPGALEDVLSATYDLGATYDWSNQPALAGPVFIAPNLRLASLPVGGSVGGLYLLRYLMAGSAFQKVLVENPTFVASVRAQWNLLGPGDRNRANALALAESVQSTVEGRPFGEWAAEQFILDPTLTPGLKLLVQPFAITSGLAGADFGVFAIQAHVFRTLSNGDEALLPERSFPIYWSPDFTRFFTTAQDDRIDIQLGYGAVVPNFPGAPFSGQPYRVTVDVPVQDRLARVSLPAGAVATAANPTVSDFYGTVTGLRAQSGVSYDVQVSYGTTTRTLPLRNFAFGGRLADGVFERAIPLTVRVRRTTSLGTTQVMERRVNKGPGALALNLDVGALREQGVILDPGLQMVGFMLTPNDPDALTALGSQAGALAARWDGPSGRFLLAGEAGQPLVGQGFFVRSPGSWFSTIRGRQAGDTPVSVAVRSGWNMVANPLPVSVALADVRVVSGAGSILAYPDAVGTVVGPTVFRFSPAASDPVSGVPESGTYSSITNLQPGQAVWVRVVSPTGATLVFPAAAAPSGRTVSPTRWQTRVTVTGQAARAEVTFGMAAGATRGRDRAWDSESPPGLSEGLIVRSDHLARDIRPLRSGEVFPLEVSGLQPGRDYTVRLETTGRVPHTFAVMDPIQWRFWTVSPQGNFTFRASRATHRLSVLPVGVR